MKKIFQFFLAILCLCAASSLAAQAPAGFYAYTLENGLELYIQEDPASFAVRIEYVSKAGAARQERKTTGFFQLYSRLFWKNAASDLNKYKTLGADDFSAQSGTSQSRYSFKVGIQTFEAALSLFAAALKNPVFSDQAINTEFTDLKNEASSWAASPAGFINSAVDTQVFAAAPWKKDSGLYPALFAAQSTEEVRQKLSFISKNWYVPNQSALFISGPVSAENVLAQVKKELGLWERAFTVEKPETASSFKNIFMSGTQKEVLSAQNFVLVSKDFSKELIQTLIQYKAAGLRADTSFFAAAWLGADIMQSKLAAETLGSTDTAFVADALDSRIIVQGLFDVQSLSENQADPANLVLELRDSISQTAKNFNLQELLRAQANFSLIKNKAYASPSAFMEAIAANWAFGGIEHFFLLPSVIGGLPLEPVQEAFSQPWVFVLVHPDLYKKYNSSFAKHKFSLIVPETAAHSLLYKKNNAEQGQKLLGPQIDFPSQHSTQSPTIEEFKLSSGISVRTQNIEGNPWTAILLSIAGGEIQHGAKNRGIENIALQNLANSIEDEFIRLYNNEQLSYIPETQAESGLYSSTLSLSCLTQDINLVLQTTAGVFKNLKIKPSRADELLFAAAYNWRTKSSSLEYQLYAAAMETLYNGSAAQGFFDANTEFLTRTVYATVEKACLALYNPKKISIIVCGGIGSAQKDIEVLNQKLEFSFGQKNFLPSAQSRLPAITEEFLEIKPICALSVPLAPIEQTVRLRHLFTTDIPAELAGARPAKLIPTSVFFDPAQVYFFTIPPENPGTILFTALLYELAERLRLQFSTMKNPPAQSAAALTDIIPSLRFSKVDHKTALKEVLTETFSGLLKNLEDARQEQGDLIQNIKSRCARITAAEIETLVKRAKYIHKGIEFSNNPARHIEDFAVLNAASAEDFYNALEKLSRQTSRLWVFSADTKN